ncbi:MAG TPA: cytochrome c oxidase subunit 3 family protein [Candidatus Sulfotelmatobacter sp.]|nr:cytochrome c oxidase subunit 3 family protein [Candidatus Sulfotelmatobacter sp.]
MHRTGALFGQFETLEQQKDTASLGMWIFLVTEVMFFGGIMLAYTINRHSYFHAFAMGSKTLSLKLGTTNTVVLLASSFTMAMGVWSAQVGKKKLLPMFLALTITLGFIFFGIKYVEYAQKFHHHLVPGRNFDITYCVNNPSRCEDMSAEEIDAERVELQEAQAADPDLNAHAQLYYSAYFGMTGLHALHMVIGAGLLFWLLRESLKGRFTPEWNTPVDLVGLYWHFVDIVWIYLYPLLYLIDRHN